MTQKRTKNPTAATLRRIIRRQGGYILSDGTLRPEDLIDRAVNLLEQLDGFKRRAAGYRREHDSWLDPNQSGIWGSRYYRDECYEDAAWLWDEICDLFNEIGPDGYTFGSSDGDGACIGWFDTSEDY